MRNPCKDCIYYNKENRTCQSKKCATGGNGRVSLVDRMFCYPLIEWFRPYGHTDEGIPYYGLVTDIRGMKAADVAPVVRCKDCVHYDLGVCLKIYSDGNAHPEAWQPRRPEDFCSYGEQKVEKNS